MGSRTKNKGREARAQSAYREKEDAKLIAQGEPPKWGPRPGSRKPGQRLFGRQGRP